MWQKYTCTKGQMMGWDYSRAVRPGWKKKRKEKKKDHTPLLCWTLASCQPLSIGTRSGHHWINWFPFNFVKHYTFKLWMMYQWVSNNAIVKNSEIQSAKHINTSALLPLLCMCKRKCTEMLKPQQYAQWCTDLFIRCVLTCLQTEHTATIKPLYWLSLAPVRSTGWIS